MDDKDKSTEGLPPAEEPGQGPRRVRREDGARQTVSEPVVFLRGDSRVEGWALNMSRGGLRAIVESPLEVGGIFEIAVGEESGTRKGRIVWVQEERDGAIVGVSFLDVPHASSPPPPAGAPPPPSG